MIYMIIKLKIVDSNDTLAKSSDKEVYRVNNEKRLIDDLFKNYQVKFGRPVNNMSEKVVVYFGIYLIQIIDLVNIYLKYLFFFVFQRIFFISIFFSKQDERNQVLVSNVKSIYVR